MTRHGKSSRWFVPGDLNGFFGLMFDNITVLSFLAGILIFAFKFPADVVYERMFPGTAFGVMIGDLIYTWMGRRLARQTGKPVTAMPLGLDTPSTIGMALIILGPAFLSFKAAGLSEHEAAMMTWYVGMATTIMMGVVKLVLSFFGPWLHRVIPQAGLLGSIAGIGLALIGFMPLLDVFGMPLVGLLSLGLIFYTLVAGIRLPGGLPSVLVTICVGTVLYYILAPTGIIGDHYVGFPTTQLHFGFPLPTLAFIDGFGPALRFLPLSIPFAILTVVGGVNVTESARVAGDNYNTKEILLTEAVATLIAGFCGGVAQSTPYIGQPAYKRMGAQTGYTLLTAIFIGLGGIFGYVSFIVELIPRAVLAPILIFVAMDIVVQSFEACPRRHSWAVAFAFFPSIARMLSIKLSNPEVVPAELFHNLLNASGRALPDLLVTIALGNGFILTAMLWGAYLAELINRRLKHAATYLGVLAIFSFFGIIHSASPDGLIYLPWTLTGLAQQIPYQFALAYFVLAVVTLALSFTKGSREPFQK
jgi:AGZA family xanthine/uracil permease-like MFS transporter